MVQLGDYVVISFLTVHLLHDGHDGPKVNDYMLISTDLLILFLSPSLYSIIIISTTCTLHLYINWCPYGGKK
jgi:hypothetical protein